MILKSNHITGKWQRVGSFKNIHDFQNGFLLLDGDVSYSHSIERKVDFLRASFLCKKNRISEEIESFLVFWSWFVFLYLFQFGGRFLLLILSFTSRHSEEKKRGNPRMYWYGRLDLSRFYPFVLLQTLDFLNFLSREPICVIVYVN